MRPSQRYRSSSRLLHPGFMLVELLVVIGIIAVLVAILMPALTTAKRQAMTVQCGANLRSIGQAMQSYANEFKGRVPRDYWYDLEYRQGHILWAEAFAKYVNYRDMPDVPNLTMSRDLVLAPHLARIGVYQCPAHPDDRQPLDYVSNAWHAGSIGVSAPLINVVRMPHSGRVVYLADAFHRLPQNMFGTHDVFDVPHLPVNPIFQPQTTSRVLNDKRHGGRLNLLFLDGHVESRPFRDVGRADFDFLFR